MTPKLEAYLKSRGALVERALERCAAPARFGPSALAEAARYSLFAGGKRMRPVLVLAAAEACGGESLAALPAACALELVHTYSLIHDDLPAMDDDDLRRGRPTNHRVYGDAIAILAGDALLTRAFGVIADAGRRGALTPAQAVETAALLAEAAGGPGMVGGQTLDINSSRSLGVLGSRGLRQTPRLLDSQTPRPLDAVLLERIHRMKTAALITAAAESGAIAANASIARRKSLRVYGENLGLAFQIVDDVLDRVGDKSRLGKSGSDARNGKLTYPAVHGLDRSRAEAARLSKRAIKALAAFGAAADPLRWLAEHALTREK